MKGNLRRLLAIFLVLMLLSADICAIAEAVATLTLPSALQIIDEEAFAGNTSIEKVIVPDGTTEIRSRAFADSSMTELVLPDSLTFIAEDAFEGCGEFALTVPENCYAYDRCVELGLIKVDEPDPSVIESAHPYPDDFDYTWTYDAGEGTESVTITFSADTETEEDYDFIYLYTLDNVQVGQYSGTELAGQSVTIDGTGFKLRLTSDEAWGGGNTYYGFKLDSIVPKKAVPLTFESIAAESSAVNAGEIIRWTVATTGGKAPVYYDYTVLLGEEEVATGTVEAPNAIEYMPVRAGKYKLSVIARDNADVVLPAQLSEAVTVAPSTAYPESAHPYAANMDQSWVYAAEENVESLTVTFSEETKTQSNYDYIWIYDQYGTQVGKYSGTQLAGQTIEIMGSAFTIRLTSNGSTQYHGFTITNIEKYIPGPLTFVSLTVDKAKAKTGDLITWAMETEGGRRPVTYEYTVTLNGETKYTGSVTRPEQITYVPMTAGDYTMSVVAKDVAGNELPAQTSKVRITERGETAAEYFTVEQTAGSFGKITSYIGTDTAVVIPSVIGDYTIEAVGANVFKNNTSIISVSMPATLKSIGSYAFYGCSSLQGVNLNDGLEIIYREAFRGCTSLTELYIPDSVTTLSYRSFYGCSKLSEMNYPVGWVTTFNDSNNDSTASYYDHGQIFAGTALKSILIPEGVLNLTANAFRDCTNFTYFELPDSLQSIPAYAFAGCTNLEKIWIPEGIKLQYDEEGNQTSFVPIDSTAFNDVSTSTMSIHGVSGSYAETFAAENGYPFVAEAFEYTPATLSGTVTDAASNPLSGVIVTVYKGPTTNYPFGSTITDSAGAWSVSNVKVGSCYTIGFGKEGYNFTPNYETVYNIVENHVYTTVIGNAAPAVLSAEFAVDTVCLDTATSIMVTTEEDAGVLAMYAENRDWGRCAVWSVASAQTEVVDGVRVWNVQYTFNTTGDRTLSFAASTDGKTEGEEKTASIKVVEAEMDITVQDFELSRYIAEPEDTISIYGTVSGGDRELQLVTVSLCPDGDASQGVEIWSSNPGKTEFDLSTIPELVVGQTYSGTDYTVAQVYNRARLLDATSTYEATGDSSVTMKPGCDYEIVVNAALTDGTTIEEEIISRSVIVQETTVYTGEVATQTSEAGKAFIKLWENCYLYVYDDKTNGEPYDPDKPNKGNPTIGWGHKIVDGESFTTITQEEADALFERDLLRREDTVNLFLTLTGAKVNQQQYDALSAFFYNGNGGATSSSTCMFKLFAENANNLDGIPDWRIYNQFANYYNRTDSSVRVGLHKRRLDEARIFTEGIYERRGWNVEDWVRNGEPVSETWVPSELGEIEYAELEAPEFSYYPEQLYQGANVNVSWEPVEGANYYNLWYRLNTWDEAKYAMCGTESWTNAIDFGDATAMWISLYAMIDGSHHGPGTTIEMKISDLGDLSFTGYSLGQTEALDISDLSSDGFKLGWSCQNAVKYQYKILVLSQMPSGDDQASAAEKVYTGTALTDGMTITSDMLQIGKYLKIAVVPVGKNGNLGTWRWIGLKIEDSKPDLTKPVWDIVPPSITSGESFTISWEPVDNAVYYNLWYRVDGTDTMRYKRIEAPACSAKLTAISTVDTTLHVSLYALTTADNHSAGAYKGLSLTGVAGGINYGLWEYQPGDYFTNDKCECAVHTTNIKCKNTYTDGDTVIQLGASQCFGFARYAQYEMYGVTSYKNSSSFSKTDGLSYANMDEESLRELITEAGVGAHLRTGSSSSSTWGHSMIITNITEEGFSIIQCNGRNNDQGFSYEACRIGTHTYTWDEYMNDSYGKRGIEYIEYYNK